MYVPYPRTRSLVPVLNRRMMLGLALLMILTMLAVPHPLVVPATTLLPTSAKPGITPDFGRLPLSFVPNAGQVDPTVRFQVRGLGGTIFFTQDEVVLSLPMKAEGRPTADDRQSTIGRFSLQRQEQGSFAAQPPSVVRLRFDGANPVSNVTGTEQLPGIVNYFIGNDPAKWRTNMPTYAGIVYEQLYPGIDLRYDGTGAQLKGTYLVAPGADPTLIHWRYNGASSVRVDKATRDLQIELDAEGRTLTERAPVAWQEIGGRRVPVSASYAVADDGSVGFALGSYDTTQALVVDPTLVYSTYLGGSEYDAGHGIAVDGAGNVYITGQTQSADFPILGPASSSMNGYDDVFIAKLNANGSALLYGTYIGGKDSDVGYDVALDSLGNVYLTGSTQSSDFPTVSAFQSQFGSTGPDSCGGPRVQYPCPDAFVVKLNSNNSLLYSTYIGGIVDDIGNSIAVDNVGSAYIIGDTSSSNFPLANPIQAAEGGAFITKLSAIGSSLIYSTYLGDYTTWGGGIAVDSAGNAYLAGGTSSINNFPLVQPLQPVFGGVSDAFVAKLNAAGSVFIYSTYLGGSGGDGAISIVVDSAGNAYVTGSTNSSDFPTLSPLQATSGGSNCSYPPCIDAFVTKVNHDGNALIYSTYLGGSGNDNVRDITVDGAGNAYITGMTYSADFPMQNPLDSSYGDPDQRSESDAFVAKLRSAGDKLDYSTYLGGTSNAQDIFLLNGHKDFGESIMVDSVGNAYIVGYTNSSDFPTTSSALQKKQIGNYDAFVTKISNADVVSPAPSNQVYLPLL